MSSWDHGALPLSRSGSLVRAPAPVCGRLHTLVERGRHGPFLWTVEHRLLYIRCERIRICEVKIHTHDSSAHWLAWFWCGRRCGGWGHVDGCVLGSKDICVVLAQERISPVFRRFSGIVETSRPCNAGVHPPEHTAFQVATRTESGKGTSSLLEPCPGAANLLPSAHAYQTF